jgi:hypothetical protein
LQVIQLNRTLGDRLTQSAYYAVLVDCSPSRL